MKLTIVVLFSVVTFVACSNSCDSSDSIPAIFRKSVSGKGTNCWCRKKTCTDVSCEEKNCICLVGALKGLQDRCGSNYPKKYVDTYLQLVQERCLCIQGCQKICSPDEFIKCSSAAYDRFLCKYQDFLEGIIKSKGSDKFVEDIKNLSADCINKDCKPICSGNADCDPFAITGQCSNIKKCVQKLIDSFAQLLKDADVKEELNEFSIYSCAFYDQSTNCQHLPPKSQQVCVFSAGEEIARAVDKLFTNMVNIVGPCTAISILSALKQGIIDCALRG